MSAAATAAGYLYASGRLRGRGNCDKRRYDTQGEAIGIAVHRTGRGAPTLRAYCCDRCGGWHLTKAAKRS